MTFCGESSSNASLSLLADSANEIAEITRLNRVMTVYYYNDEVVNLG